MSRLILKGDVRSNIGEFLPAPFIDRIYIEGTDSESQLRVQTSVFVSDEIDRVVSENGVAVSDESAYKSALEKINYYTLIMINMSHTGFYEDIINGEVNPLALYKYTNSLFSGKTEICLNGSKGRCYSVDFGTVYLSQIYPLSETPETLFDENGNKILKYMSEKTFRSPTSVVEYGGVEAEEILPDSWNSVTSMQVLAFASTENLDDLPEKEEDANMLLLDTQISDISYEKVFENGLITDRNQSEYIDNNDAIYDQTAMIAIDSLAYKVNKISHEQIAENFQDLLNQYSGEYEKEAGNAKLKRMMDNISFILETFGDKADLLPQLNTLRRAFPDKTPAKPIGKFYKSFRERIFNINKVVKNGQALKRKIVYNGKVVDLRATPIGDEVTLSHDGSPIGSNYIYSNNWVASKMGVGDEYTDNKYEVVSGYFFFDYEKALRRTSDISQLFDINKLENWGSHIPYDSYEVIDTYVNRYGSEEDVTIGCAFVQEQTYPVMNHVYLQDQGTADRLIVNPSSGHRAILALQETPYGLDSSAADDWAANGYISSLVLRNFINPTNIQFSSIKDYRLMCYELLDYQQNSTATEYTARTSITDKTVNIAQALTASCRTAYEDFKEYYDFASNELCSFNEDIGVFNNFFSEGALARYEDSESAPWYRGPINYLLHLDLIYDTYRGDIDQITKTAQTMSDQLNPVHGSRQAIEDFNSTFSEFINNVYGAIPNDRTSIVGDKMATMIGGYTKTFETTLVMPTTSRLTITTGDALVATAGPEDAGGARAGGATPGTATTGPATAEPEDAGGARAGGTTPGGSTSGYTGAGGSERGPDTSGGGGIQ